MKARTPRLSIIATLRNASILRVVLVCLVLVAQSLVPFSSFASATMRCAAPSTGKLCAMQVVDASLARDTASTSTVTPECCKRMKLDCPMLRAAAMAARSAASGVVAPASSTRSTCQLTVASFGSERSVSTTATPSPITAPVATQPARSASVAQRVITQVPTTYRNRPPPLRQSQIALSTRPLRAPTAV